MEVKGTAMSKLRVNAFTVSLQAGLLDEMHVALSPIGR